MARRTKEEAEQTRDSLLRVAEKLFLEKGVAKTSLVDIAKAAGVTRGAVYWHFEDKEALFTAMHEQVKLPFDLLLEEAIAKDDPVEALKFSSIQSLQRIVSDVRARHVFTILMFRCDHQPGPSGDREGCSAQRERQCRSGVIQKMEAVLTRIHAAGKLTPELTPAEAALALHAFICGLFCDFVRNPGEYDLARLAPVFVERFFKGMIVEG